MKKISDLKDSVTSIPLELRLLILCAKYNITEEQQREIIKLMQRPVNWEVFYQMVVKNRVYPLVYKNLKKLKTSKLDEQVLTRLEKDYKKNQLWALLLTQELFKVMELLKQRNIKAISIKGPSLAMSIYQEVSLRVSSDLDILVNPSDIVETDRVLMEMGYEKDNIIKHLSLKQTKLLIKTFHHFTYSNPSGIQLELHWRLSNDYYNVPFEEIWNNKSEITMFGKNLNVLSEEENLVYLILHGSKHAWKRLRWLCDIYEIMKNKALNWDYILKRSEGLGVLHLLEQTLILLKALFHYQVQLHPMLSKNDRTIATRLAAMSLPFLSSLDDEPERYGHPLYKEYKKYMLVWYKGVDRKLRFLASHFTPNTDDFQSTKLQDKFFILYYLLRLVKILNRCLFACRKRIVQISYIRKEQMSSKNHTRKSLTKE